MRALIVSGALFLAVFLATVPLPRVDGHLVGSDGMYYFSVLRSLVLDRDLDLTNDYALLGVTGAGTAPTGRPACPWAIGSALLWLPFYLVALAVAHGLALAGLAAPPDGTGLLPEAFVGAASIVYATAGLLIAYRVARRYTRDDGPAVLAALAAWWATSLVEYTVAEPSMSHALSFFANALFLGLWTAPATRALTVRRCALLGASAALVALVRWQDGLVLLVPLAEVGVASWRAARRGAPGWLSEAAPRLAACLAAFAVGFVPQMLMWRSIYGSFLTVPQGEGFMAWTAPHVAGVLFSTRHGLVTWHPVTLLMLAGLVPLWRRQRALACATGGLFVAQVYVNAATSDW